MLSATPLDGRQTETNREPKDLDKLPDAGPAKVTRPLANSQLHETAKRIGLEGKWIVRSVKKDGEFSKAKIGQQINDVISIYPKAKERDRLFLS